MPTTIRAAVCRAFGEPLTVEELILADPAAGQVQVAVSASSICHSDIHFFSGQWGGVLPAVWGHEVAGTVEALGSGVDNVAVGDHVVVTLVRSCGRCRNCRSGRSVVCTDETDQPSPLTDRDGSSIGQGVHVAGFATNVVVDQSQVVKIDPSVESVPASLLGCGVITGVGAALNTAEIEPGSSVVVIGTGGVGLNAIQGARLAGASPIIAIDINDAKLDAARTFGATDTINSAGHGDEAVDPVSRVAEMTDGALADYVLITVGAKGPIELAPHLLGPAGTAVIVGMAATGVTVSFDPTSLASSNQSLLGSKMGTSTIAVDIPALAERYRDGDLLLDELVTATYRLDDINEAIAAVENGEALRNVIVFDHAVGDTVKD